MDSEFMKWLGGEVQRMVTRAVGTALSGVEVARYVKVATTAQLGASPFSTRTGPNGTTQDLAKVWIDDDPDSGQAVSLVVAPGVSLSEGDVVRIVKDRLFGPWTWITWKV